MLFFNNKNSISINNRDGILDWKSASLLFPSLFIDCSAPTERLHCKYSSFIKYFPAGRLIHRKNVWKYNVGKRCCTAATFTSKTKIPTFHTRWGLGSGGGSLSSTIHINYILFFTLFIFKFVFKDSTLQMIPLDSTAEVSPVARKNEALARYGGNFHTCFSNIGLKDLL